MEMRSIPAVVSSSERRLMTMKSWKSKSREKGLRFKASSSRWAIKLLNNKS
jgi:hypothetical protein